MMGRGEHNDRKRPSQRASTGRSSPPATSSSESINTPVHQPSGLSSPPGPIVPEQSLNNRSLDGPDYSPVSSPNILSAIQPDDRSKKPKHNPREGSDNVSTEDAELQSVPVPSHEGEGQSTLPLPPQAPYPYSPSMEVPIPCPESKGRPAFPPLPYTPHPYSLCTGLSEEEFNKTVTQLFMDTGAGNASRKELFPPPAFPALSVVKTGLSERERGRLASRLEHGNALFAFPDGTAPVRPAVLAHLQHYLPFSVVDRYDAQDMEPIPPSAGPWNPMRESGYMYSDSESPQPEVWVPSQETGEEWPGAGWTQATLSNTLRYIPTFRIPNFYRVPLFSSSGQERWVGFLNFSRTWDADPQKDPRASYLFRCCDRTPCLDGGEKFAQRQRGLRAQEFRKHILEVHQISLDMTKGIGYLVAPKMCKMCGVFLPASTSGWDCPHFLACPNAWSMHMDGEKWWDDVLPASASDTVHDTASSQ